MKCYKLTHSNMETYGGFKWELGVPAKTDGGGVLCSPGWLHAYHDPLLAVFLDPIHGDFGPGARMFEAEAEGQIKTDHGLKLGSTQMTLVKEIEMPKVTLDQRVAFAKLCAEFAATATNGPGMNDEEILEQLMNCAYAATGLKR